MTSFFKILLIIILTAVLIPSAGAQEFATVGESRRFRLEAPKGEPLREAHADWILEHAELAVDRVAEQLPAELGRTITLQYCPTAMLFSRVTAGQSESTLAAARGKLGMIYLNGEALRAENPVTFEQVMRHEYSHVYVAQTIPHGLPRWLDEGLAMHLAAEWGMWDSVSLRKAHALNHLLPLRELAGTFPEAPGARQLAYQQSYSVVAYMIAQRAQRDGGGKGDRTAAGLIRALQSPGPGQVGAQDYWGGLLVTSLEAGWKQWLGGRWLSALAVVGSSGFFWFGVALLFLAAWWIKRQRAAAKHEAWEEEEKVFAVLDEAQGPPGDPEDYLPEPTPYEKAYEIDDEEDERWY